MELFVSHQLQVKYEQDEEPLYTESEGLEVEHASLSDFAVPGNRRNSRDRNAQDSIACPICDRKYSSQLWFTRHMATHNIQRSNFHDAAVHERDPLQTSDEETPNPYSNIVRRPRPPRSLVNSPDSLELVQHGIASSSTSNSNSFDTNTNKPRKNHECQACQRSFDNVSRLKSHMTTHTEEKEFNCEFCPYKSGWKTNFQRHMRTHAREQFFACSICLYRCGDKESLLKHEKTHIHPNINMFQCTDCSAAFLEKSGFKQHLQDSPCQFRFKCSICSMPFRYEASLKSHVSTHKIEIIGEEEELSTGSDYSSQRMGQKSGMQSNSSLKNNGVTKRAHKLLEYSRHPRTVISSTPRTFTEHLKKIRREPPKESQFSLQTLLSGEAQSKCVKLNRQDKYIQTIYLTSPGIRTNQSGFSKISGSQFRSTRMIDKLKFRTETIAMNCVPVIGDSANVEGLVHTAETQTNICSEILERATKQQPLQKFSDSCKVPINNEPKRAKKPSVSVTPLQSQYYFRNRKKLIQQNSRPNIEKPFQCSVCLKNHTHEQELHFHERMHSKEAQPRKYKCEKCPEEFSSFGSMKSHLNSEHPDSSVKNQHEPELSKSFECSICRKRFDCLDELQMHSKLHYGENEFQCLLCPYKTDIKYNLKRHMGIHGTEDQFQPPISVCNPLLLEEAEHVEKRDNIQRYQCKKCFVPFGTPRNLKCHMRSKHRKIQLICHLCPKIFYLKDRYENHILAHGTDAAPGQQERSEAGFKEGEFDLTPDLPIDGSNKSVPPLYGEVSVSNKVLNSVEDDDELPFKCSQCTRAYSQKRTLNKHVNRSHSGTSPVECEICHRKFAHPDFLRGHMLTHGEKSFQCSNCNKRFRRKVALEIHQDRTCKSEVLNSLNNGQVQKKKGVESQQKFKCELCPAVFARRVNVKVHVNQNHKEDQVKLFQCHQCPKKYFYEFRLRAHLVTHSSELSFKCDICTKKFKHEKSLWRHSRKYHYIVGM